MKTLARRTTATAFAALLAIGLTAVPAGAASEWDLDYSGPTGGISSFGHESTATYGQTITVPVGPATLESLSLEMAIPGTVVFRVVVQAWDDAASHATGPALYTSAPMSIAGTGTETVTVTPNVPVTPGMYVLYATTTYDWTVGTGYGAWPTDGEDPYAGGSFVYYNHADDADLLTTTRWDGATEYDEMDLGFTVVFAAPVVPPVTPPATPVTGAPRYTG